MDDFSVKPGAANLYGVVGGDANAIAPGKRPLSTMTPTIEYGGTFGQTQFFVSGRYFGSTLGLENPTPAQEAFLSPQGEIGLFPPLIEKGCPECRTHKPPICHPPRTAFPMPPKLCRSGIW